MLEMKLRDHSFPYTVRLAQQQPEVLGIGLFGENLDEWMCRIDPRYVSLTAISYSGDG